MAAPSLVSRIRGALVGFRSPAGGMANTVDGWIPLNWDWNFWQEGKNPLHMECCAAVEAAVSAYAQTVAMCPGMVWRKNDDGGRTELPKSPLAQVLFQPNDYQTRSDFLMNQVRALLFRGNAYALAVRNEAGAITSLHPISPQHVQPHVDPDTQEVFYSIAPTDLTPDQRNGWPYDAERMVPAMYVWHVRMQTPWHPLIGVTPLTSACMAIAANCGISSQQMQFFNNMSRPSGTLNTDMVLTKAQVDDLRERWKEQSAGMAIGGVPILSAGLKWQALSMSAADSQLIDYYKLSTADIARALRVPLPLIGVMDGATFNNTEVLMTFWKASGLGWLLEHIELSLDQFFGLPQGTYCELDTSALLRSNFKERIEGLVRGVQGGVYAPNEARREEGLPAVQDGDDPRVQQQLVPLSFTGQLPTGAAPVAPADNDEPDEDDEAPLNAPAAERAAMVEALEHAGHNLVELRTKVAVLEERTRSAGEYNQQAIAMVTNAVTDASKRFDHLCIRLQLRMDQLRDGQDGAPGKDADMDAINEMVFNRLAQVRDGAPGLPGADGQDGADGRDGLDADTDAILEALRAEVASLMDGVNAQLSDMVASCVDQAVAGIVSDTDSILANINTDLNKALDTYTNLCTQVQQKLTTLKDGEPGTPGEAGPPGQFLEQWRGDWSKTAIYQRHDVVRTVDGGVYVAQTLTHANPYNTPGEWTLVMPAPMHGKGFQFRGEWHPGMSVNPGDVVRGDAGAAWIWMGDMPDVSNVLPGEHWQLMVKQGATGGRGKPGPSGPAGTGIESIDAGLGCLVFSLTDGRVITVPFGEGIEG